jgi:hypothetical protein
VDAQRLRDVLMFMLPAANSRATALRQVCRLAPTPRADLGVSGVIAAVVVGLVIGYRVAELSSLSARVRGFAFWDVLVFC